MSKIVLVDGHSILNRAFYGLPDLTNKLGQHTNAVYGFLNILFHILEEEQPEYLAVAFDVKAPTFRHEMFEAYKGTRKPMPQELREQVPMIKEVLLAMNIRIVEKAGLEADDILGTIAKNSEAAGMEVALISGDRDLLQIATDHIKIRIPKTKQGKTEIEDYYTKDVLERYRVQPEGIIELKALMGDTADNIPGVPKIGEKTATDLIEQYQTIENLYAHLDEITKKSIHDTLAENRDLADLSKKLATINIHGEFEFELEEAAIQNFYTKEAYQLFKDLEFKNFLKRFDENASTQKIEIAKNYYEVQSVDELNSLLQNTENIGISFLEEEGVFVFAAATKEKCAFLSIRDEQNKEFLRKWILEACQKNITISVFDVKKIYSALDIPFSTKLFDTGLAAYLCNPLKNDYEIHDVADEHAAFRYRSYQEIWAKQGLSIIFMTDYDRLKEYICDCAFGNLLSTQALTDKLSMQGMLTLYETIEMPLTFVLYSMEKEGVLVKPEELDSYGKVLEEQIKVLEQKIYELAGEQFNINSPKQLGELLFDKLGLPSGKKTKTGYSTNADVLEKLAPDYPIVQSVLEYRGLSKLKSTYADGLRDCIAYDGRIHTNFNQTITATGRISSTEPNLQNIPIRTELGRQIRKVFVPKEGCVFLDADYSQIELRLLAHMSGDEELIDAYRNNADIHRLTASKVFHVPFDEVTPLQRRNAKAVNFGIVYGISSFGLSQDLSISKKEASEYIAHYFETYPGIKKYLDDCVADAKKNGYSVTLFGRRRPIPELASSNFIQRNFGERVAMNAPIQGTAADIMKIAMIHIFEKLNKEKLKSKLILQVHDEVLVETYEEEVEAVTQIVKDSMMQAASLKVPMETDIHTGANWYEAK